MLPLYAGLAALYAAGRIAPKIREARSQYRMTRNVVDVESIPRPAYVDDYNIRLNSEIQRVRNIAPRVTGHGYRFLKKNEEVLSISQVHSFQVNEKLVKKKLLGGAYWNLSKSVKLPMGMRASVGNLQNVLGDNKEVVRERVSKGAGELILTTNRLIFSPFDTARRTQSWTRNTILSLKIETPSSFAVYPTNGKPVTYEIVQDGEPVPNRDSRYIEALICNWLLDVSDAEQAPESTNSNDSQDTDWDEPPYWDRDSSVDYI